MTTNDPQYQAIVEICQKSQEMMDKHAKEVGLLVARAEAGPYESMWKTYYKQAKKPVELKQANFSGLLFSHVKFEKSPNAAVEQDNIYTTWGTLTDQELKRQIGVDPKDPGSGAEEPMDDEDSYLVSDEKQP